MWKEELVKEACRKFRGTESSLKRIGGFWENVYEYERDGEACVLKLIPIAVKDRNLIYSELQWVSFLRTQGIRIPRQILSVHGKTVEEIRRLPVPCCIISFQKAPGKFVNPENPSEWNRTLFRRWGQVMGRMHSLSGKFHRHQSVPPFEEWNEGEIYHRDLSFAESSIRDRLNACLARIETFPKNERSYGLIHNDFHHRNFLLSYRGEMILFDFADVKYHWFTYDIAIALYHALSSVEQQDRAGFKTMFLESFMSGYLLEHQLEEGWEEQIDFFLEFRLLFSYLHQMTHLNREKASEETIRHLRRMKEKLLRGESVLAS
ncbi:phosphotransferase enzyme family protein [Lihuaxuella thermophila]|uniref:Ser/Thr protein kinase RdoA involved in Cpx stress response, MazF antagonist n=1 Tax=Lihuaxuella thermophila TaxID=1173111 RepID=A0A1H8GAI7_9BACL|nr:phosphotransferase [Lihuaxuella thermophila]SEN40298.1 Ser/Thr protein kinase RdoA involved in Cpx stress response, MazF antagonist [Lihuaxuella thermophila]